MRSSAYTPVWLRLDKFVKISYDRKAIKNACTVRNERGIAMEHNHLHDHAAALPAQMPPESQLADVAELFKIFGDLTRVRIIFVLFQHEECVMDIAQKLEMTQSAISHQLRVLKQSRLVTSRREAVSRVRNCPKHLERLDGMNGVSSGMRPRKANFQIRSWQKST